MHIVPRQQVKQYIKNSEQRRINTQLGEIVNKQTTAIDECCGELHA